MEEKKEEVGGEKGTGEEGKVKKGRRESRRKRKL